MSLWGYSYGSATHTFKKRIGGQAITWNSNDFVSIAHIRVHTSMQVKWSLCQVDFRWAWFVLHADKYGYVR